MDEKREYHCLNRFAKKREQQAKESSSDEAGLRSGDGDIPQWYHQGGRTAYPTFQQQRRENEACTEEEIQMHPTEGEHMGCTAGKKEILQ